MEFSLHLKIIMKKLLIYMIQFYRRYLSPMKSTKCPYIPTCSEYGLEAVSKYGAFKGGLLTVWRILRCNPFSKGGYDPVPWNTWNEVKKDILWKSRRKEIARNNFNSESDLYYRAGCKDSRIYNGRYLFLFGQDRYS